MSETQIPAHSSTARGPRLPVSSGNERKISRKADVAHVVLRVFCLMSSVAALLLMVTAEQSATISVYGFEVPVHSKWSFVDSFVFLVGMSSMAVTHSLLQLVLSVGKLLRKSPLIPSRRRAWILFAGDQLFAYMMMSAGSASAGVANLNHTGFRHSALPDFCKPLHLFCERAILSIIFAFVSSFMLASTAVLDVLWLSMH